MSKITKIHAREILDSRETRRWRWTLIWKAERQLARPFQAERQPVPKKRGSSATATKRFLGKGVLKAVANVNKIIAKALTGKEADNQKEIDRMMIGLDGTPNKKQAGRQRHFGSLNVGFEGGLMTPKCSSSLTSPKSLTEKLTANI